MLKCLFCNLSFLWAFDAIEHQKTTKHLITTEKGESLV